MFKRKPKLRWVGPDGKWYTWRRWSRRTIKVVIDPSPGIDERVEVELDPTGSLHVRSNQRTPRMEP